MIISDDKDKLAIEDDERCKECYARLRGSKRLYLVQSTRLNTQVLVCHDCWQDLRMPLDAENKMFELCTGNYTYYEA